MTVYRPSKTVVFAALIAAATAAAPSGPIFAGEGHGMPFGHAGQPDEVDRTVRVKARDIAFDRSQIEAQPGETIRFVITNTGAMEHEFTIGPPEVQRKHRREMRD
ncbi:MAG: copper-binding protein, partial [Thiohalorhabdaceae bacterium]